MRHSRPLSCGLAFAFVAALHLAPGIAAAQGPAGGRCDLIVDQAGRFNSVAVDDAGQVRNSYIGGGFIARCAGQDVRLRADSAEAYGASNLLYLIGNVHYTEPRVKVDADRMTYFRNDERLLMEGNVVAVQPTGTTMRGPQADYYRAITGLRARQRLVAPGRPKVTLVEKDTVGRHGEPTRVVANLITMDGDSLLYANGDVQIIRTDLEARGDSAFLDGGREFARLMRQPRIVGKQRRPFTLEGAVIDLYSRKRQLERVVSMVTAKATSEDLRLESDTIDMRMRGDSVDNGIERVFVWGKSRARATSPERDILADSLDVRMPHQRLHEVHAVGKAFAQTAADTTRIRNSTDRDWMRGDTIVAFFDTTQVKRTAANAPSTVRPLADTARSKGARAAPPAGMAATVTAPNAANVANVATASNTAVAPTTAAAPASRDTASHPRLQRLEAVIDAQAFYQAANQNGPDQPPSLCYSRGRIIVLTFAENEAQRVTVSRGPEQVADGVCLEPGADSTAATSAPVGQAGEGAGARGPRNVRPSSSRPPISPVRRP